MKRFWKKRWLPLPVLIPLLLYAAAAVWTSTRNVSQLPVLMYHHISEDVATDMVISPARFEAHMAALKEHGWNSVTIRQLIEFGEQGTPLPDHPVLITFDDGYTSNLELAAPILERHGLNAVIFVIGINAGQSVYAHSGQPLDPPRFALKDVRPYLESGVLEVESHTFDLHQRADYGYSGREGVLPLAGEPEDAYRQVLAGDCRQARQLFAQELGQQVTALVPLRTGQPGGGPDLRGGGDQSDRHLRLRPQPDPGRGPRLPSDAEPLRHHGQHLHPGAAGSGQLA